MNKYQDALNLLKSWAKKDRNAYSPKHLKNINDCANILQEAVDKANHRNPNLITTMTLINAHVVKKEYETYYDGYLKKFCSECGQALDWSENL